MSLFFSKKMSKSTYDVLPEFTTNSDVADISKYSHKVIRDIMAILTTMKGKTLYKPNYGTSVLSSIWDLNNELTLDSLKTTLRSAFDTSLDFSTKRIDIVPSKNSAKITIVLKLSEFTDFTVLVNMTKNGYITLEDATELTTNYIMNEIN